MKSKNKIISISVETQLLSVIDTSIGNGSRAKFLRKAIIDYLKKNKKLPQDYRDEITNGGDRLGAKLKTATPEEAAKIKRSRADHAAKMRAAKRAKHAVIADNNSGIIIAGDNQGNIDASKKI